jgi:DNA-binding transcriptional regulator YiaG
MGKCVKNEETKNFSEQLYEARKKSGLTQQNVQVFIGVPVSTLQDWESGRRTPPAYVRKLIIEQLFYVVWSRRKVCL